MRAFLPTTSLVCVAALLLPGLAAAEPLEPGQTLERAIARGERHTFTVEVPAGEMLFTILDNEDITLELELRGPGAPPHKAIANANQLPVPLYWLADTPATVEIDIHCPGGIQGRYALEVETRSPTVAERELWAGQTAYQEGQRHGNAGRASVPQAYESYRTALACFERAGDRARRIETLLDLAAIEHYRDERARALETVLEAHALAQGQGVLEASTWHGLGAVYMQSGQIQKALEAEEKARAIAHEHRAYVLAAVASNTLGMISSSLSDHAKSLKHREEAVALIEKYGARPDQEVGHMDQLGHAYANVRRYEEAEAMHRRTLERWRSMEGRGVAAIRGEVSALTNLGIVQRRRGAFAGSLESLQRALALSTNHSKHSVAVIEYEIANCYKDMGELEKALATYLRSYDLVKDIPSVHLSQWMLPAQMAEVERDRGRLDEARRWIDLSVKRIEEAHATFTNQGLRTTHSARTARVFDLQVDILMRQHEAEPGKGLDRAAFETSEHGRARTLLDVLKDAHVDIAGDAGAPLTSTTRVTVEQLQALLDPQTVLVEYNLGGPRGYAWVVSSEAFSSHVLPVARDEVATAARTLHERWSERSRRVAGESARVRRKRLAEADAESAGLGQRLSAALLAPIPSLARYKRLLVVADGVLHYVPFAALPLPSSTEPMIATHEVVHLPSAGVAVALRQRRGQKTGSKRVAVFADPVFVSDDPRVRSGRFASKRPPDVPRDAESSSLLDAGADLNVFREGMPAPSLRLPRLFYTRRLADDVLRHLPADQRLAAYDFAASRESVTRSDLEDYRLLMFATHGILNTQYPELSGLALSMVDAEGREQDGFLRLQDIYELKLRADLVVLGACETALGKEMRGEGLIGLSRGFLHAGAARVLASLWKVDEQATVELLQELRRAADADGMSYPGALREAQRRLARRPRFQSPYYWAGFVLQGDWQ